MGDKNKFNFLGTLLSLFAIGACVLGYYLTEEKSVWYLKLLNELMPHLIGPILIILIIYYFFTTRGIYFFTSGEGDKSQNFSLNLSDIPKEVFGIELTSHVNDAKVEKVTKFYGTYKQIPKNIALRVYVVNENQNMC